MKRDKSDVTQEENNRPFFIDSHVDDGVLGKHAGQLLLERRHSCFRPCVMGVLCVKTEVRDVSKSNNTVYSF